jgi:hypothetical protein
VILANYSSKAKITRERENERERKRLRRYLSQGCGDLHAFHVAIQGRVLRGVEGDAMDFIVAQTLACRGRRLVNEVSAFMDERE